MADGDSKLIGSGIYTIPEAARLAGLDVRTARRWFEGRSETRGMASVRYAPIIQPAHAGTIEGAVSFLDLIELRLVDAFRRHGVSLQHIRDVSAAAREVLGSEHPFASRKLLTDGRKVFARIATRGNEPELIDLAHRQLVLRQVIEPSLFAGLTFDEQGRAQSWAPAAGRKRVVLDPARQFGAPILKSVGVPTSVMFNAFKAEGGDARRVAALYEVSAADVNAAVDFESSLLH